MKLKATPSNFLWGVSALLMFLSFRWDQLYPLAVVTMGLGSGTFAVEGKVERTTRAVHFALAIALLILGVRAYLRHH